MVNGKVIYFSSIGIESNGLVYRDFTVRMPGYDRQFAHYRAPFMSAPSAKGKFGCIEQHWKHFSRAGTCNGDVWLVCHFLAQKVLQHAGIQGIVQGDDRLEALARHQQDKFIEQAFDIAEHHRQMRPFGDDAAGVRRQLHDAEIAGEGEYQSHVGGNLWREGIMLLAKGIDGSILETRKPDDAAPWQRWAQREFADIAAASHG